MRLGFLRGLGAYENADMKEKCQKEGREDHGRQWAVDILFLTLTLCSVSAFVSSCLWFWFQVPLADLSPLMVSKQDT